MKLSTIKLFSLLLIFITVSSCSEEEKINTKTSSIQAQIITVSTSNTSAQFETSGTIEAVKSANISTRLMGFVSKINVQIGDNVKKGDVLIKLNSADLQAKKAQVAAKITQAKSAYNNAKKDFERFTTLFNEQSASQKELDNITTRFEQAKAGLKAAKEMLKEVEANLAYADIKAPFEGTITGKFINNGDLASPGMPLLSIENNKNYLVKTHVTEQQINKIKKGDVVTVLIKSNNKIVEGIVTEVSRSSKNTGGLYVVKIVLNNTKNLYSGMYVSVQFSSNSYKSAKVIIPKSVLIHNGQLTGVYTLSLQNTAILRWLRIGESYGSTVEVLSGLSPNEKIITNAKGKLYNGVGITLK